MPASPALRRIRSLSRAQLHDFMREQGSTLLEDEAIAVLANPNCDTSACDLIAQSPHLTSFHSVRIRLVAHRATPRAHALKFVHHLYWSDLLRISVDVTVPAPVRRSIDAMMLLRVQELSLGEKITSARSCSAALVTQLIREPDARVFGALLVNPRLQEDELLAYASSDRIQPEQLAVLAADRRWSQRRSVRKAVAMNPLTPRAVAASQLRHLSARELQVIAHHPQTTTYIRRCAERLMDPIRV